MYGSSWPEVWFGLYWDNNLGNTLRYDDFLTRTNIRLREAKYNVISRICANCVVQDGNVSTAKPVDVITFCNRFRKGSKSFRRVISGAKMDTIPRNMETFSDCTETVIGLSLSEKINGFWGHSFLNNDVKSFLFKLHGNILGTNSRVSHFIRDHSPVCTFCRLGRREDAENESILHLFFSCPEIEHFKHQFFVWCAAKALFSCPAIISQRLEPRITSNGPLENTEEESKII